MERPFKKGRKFSQPKGTLTRLKYIQKLVDAPKFNKELVYQKLREINTRSLKPYHYVLHLFLSARFHFNCYKQEDALEHLELASDLLDQMDNIVRRYNVKISDPNYHFTRAYVKLIIAKYGFDEYSTPRYLEKAKRITELSIRFNPGHKQFLWLKNQLAA